LYDYISKLEKHSSLDRGSAPDTIYLL
jgi:hypothetical protein